MRSAIVLLAASFLFAQVPSNLARKLQLIDSNGAVRVTVDYPENPCDRPVDSPKDSIYVCPQGPYHWLEKQTGWSFFVDGKEYTIAGDALAELVKRNVEERGAAK